MCSKKLYVLEINPKKFFNFILSLVFGLRIAPSAELNECLNEPRTTKKIEKFFLFWVKVYNSLQHISNERSTNKFFARVHSRTRVGVCWGTSGFAEPESCWENRDHSASERISGSKSSAETGRIDSIDGGRTAISACFGSVATAIGTKSWSDFKTGGTGGNTRARERLKSAKIGIGF